MSEWQDISTAPTNRVVILLLSPDGEVGIGYLESKFYGDGLTGSAAWGGKRKFDRDATIWLGGRDPSEATHWQPLPTPPTLGGK